MREIRQKRRKHIHFVRMRLAITFIILLIVTSIWIFNTEQAVLFSIIGIFVTVFQWLFPFPAIGPEQIEEFPSPDTRRIIDDVSPLKRSPDDLQSQELSSFQGHMPNPESSLSPGTDFMSDQDWVRRIAEYTMTVESGDIFEINDRTSEEM